MTSADTLARRDRDAVTAEQPSHGQPTIAHIVDKDKIAEAYIMGIPLVALCGYTWVPSRDPKPLPTCAECKEIAERNWGSEPED